MPYIRAKSQRKNADTGRAARTDNSEEGFFVQLVAEVSLAVYHGGWQEHETRRIPGCGPGYLRLTRPGRDRQNGHGG